MRRAFALALALAAALPASAAARGVEVRGAAPETYRLELAYDHRGLGKLSGREEIEFVNRSSRPLTSVWLRLWANGPDSCKPQRITVTVEAPAVAGPERVSCTALPVRLGIPVAPGATGRIALNLVVRGRRQSDRFGHSQGIALLGNVIPVLAVRDARGLHLERYSRFGESFYSLAARWEAGLSFPRRLEAATTGAVISNEVQGPTRVLTVVAGQARDFALAVGRMEITQASTDGVRVRVFSPPGLGGGDSMLASARRGVHAFTARLGRYGSHELDVVNVSAGFLGMEYPELVFTNSDRETVIHEVAHQWWYGMVGNNQHAEPWLDESFAQYSHQSVLRLGRFCPRQGPFGFSSPQARRRFPLDATMRVFDRNPLAYGNIVYFGGACALHELERDIGRRRMTSLLRLLQRRHRFGVMTKSDMLAALRHVAPNYRIRRFLRRSHLSRL